MDLVETIYKGVMIKRKEYVTWSGSYKLFISRVNKKNEDLKLIVLQMKVHEV